MSERNKAQYLRLIDEGFNAGNLEVVAETTEEAVVLRGTNGERGRGHAGLRAVIEELRAAFSGFRYEVHEMVGEGDHLAIRWSVHGVHTGPYAGFAPTHREVNVQGTSLCKFRDGKIAESFILWDVDGFKSQLGVLPR